MSEPAFLAPLGGFTHFAALAEASTSRNSYSQVPSPSYVWNGQETPHPDISWTSYSDGPQVNISEKGTWKVNDSPNIIQSYTFENHLVTFIFFFRRRLEANEEKVANSRFSSNSSPDSQSPSPPTSSSNGGSDSTNISNNDNTLYIENTLKKYSSPKHEGSLSSKHESLSSRRSYWKKRYHDHKSADEQTSAPEGESEKKIARISKSPERKRVASGGHGSAELIQKSGSETTVMENDQEKQAWAKTNKQTNKSKRATSALQVLRRLNEKRTFIKYLGFIC